MRLSEPRALFAGGGVLDDPEHRLRVAGFFQGLAEFLFVKELCDVGQSVEMLLELPLRDKKEHDEIDRLVVEGIEVDALSRTAQSTTTS